MGVGGPSGEREAWKWEGLPVQGGDGIDNGKPLWFSFPKASLAPAVLRPTCLEDSRHLLPPLCLPYSWLEETLPAWGSHLLTVVRPGLQLAWAHTNATISFLSAHCASHLAWFGDSLISLFQRVSQRQGGQRRLVSPDGCVLGKVQPHVDCLPCPNTSILYGPATDPAP